MKLRYLLLFLITGSLSAAADSQDIFTTKNEDAIHHQHDVESECNDRCSQELGRWNGLWRKIDSDHSVCQCENLEKFSTDNDDPIWGNDDADGTCPSRCGDEGGVWTGGWWTTVAGQHSVCECARTP